MSKFNVCVHCIWLKPCTPCIQIFEQLQIRVHHFLFCLVFIKIKKNQFFFNQNRFKPTCFGSVRLVYNKNRFKPIGSGLAWFFRFDSSFFRFGFGLVWFFSFRLIKPKPNRTSRHFKNSNRFNRFFLTVQVFSYFFSSLIGFFTYLYSRCNIYK
jgi:hypothetical protein